MQTKSRGYYSCPNATTWIRPDLRLNLEHWLMIDWHISPLSHHGSIYVCIHCKIYQNRMRRSSFFDLSKFYDSSCWASWFVLLLSHYLDVVHIRERQHIRCWDLALSLISPKSRKKLMGSELQLSLAIQMISFSALGFWYTMHILVQIFRFCTIFHCLPWL